MDEAVSTARRALSLKENDPLVLNDLGWTLVLAGLHDEARSVLERAVALAPADYDLPRNNLRKLDIIVDEDRDNAEDRQRSRQRKSAIGPAIPVSERS